MKVGFFGAELLTELGVVTVELRFLGSCGVQRIKKLDISSVPAGFLIPQGNLKID